MDGSGNAYVTGNTASSDFPTASALQGTRSGTNDAYVSVFNSAGSALVYSTYLGGTSSDDVGFGIAVDGTGNAYVTGRTSSSDFPTASPTQGTHGGGVSQDVFVSVLNSTGSALEFSTYLGGGGNEYGQGIAVDGSGNAYVTGVNTSTGFPTASAFDETFGGSNDAFAAKYTGFVTLLSVSIPDTFGVVGTTVQIPVSIGDPTGLSVVSVEVKVAYDRTIVTPGSPEKLDFGALITSPEWISEENILVDGVGTIDTLSFALATDADTLDSAGELVLLNLDVSGSAVPPGSTPLDLVSVLFNDGIPVAVLTDGSLTLATNAVLTAVPDSIIPRQNIDVTVKDGDRNASAVLTDSVLILAVDKIYADSQYVYLFEQTVDDSVFTGTVSTEFSAPGDSRSSVDGVISTIFDTSAVAAGDSIFVTYVDSFNTSGSPIALIDTVEVIGGADGVAIASYVVQSLDGRDGVRDTVRVQITEADLNVSALTVDSVDAVVTHTKAAATETEAIRLFETGVDSDIFEIRLPTVEGSPGTTDDGILTITGFDSLIVTYDDTLTAQGGTLTVKDTTRVISLFGDIRSNDLIQAFDAAYILATAVGLTSNTATDSLVQDVTGNNVVNGFDASDVLLYVVRLIDRFPVQTDFTPDPKNHPFAKPVPLDQIIALGDLQPLEDGTYLAPIRLGDRAGIRSGTLRIGYDAGVEVVEATLEGAYSGFMIAHNAGTDHVRVAFAGSQAKAEGPGEVVYLHVKPSGDTPLRLSLDQVYLNGFNLTPEFAIAPEVIAAIVPEDRPLVYALHQNMPNPFNPETTIRYELPDAVDVRLVVYNLVGQQIRTLVSEHQEAGRYQMTWNGLDAQGRQVGSGLYLLRMEAGSFKQTRRMLMLK